MLSLLNMSQLVCCSFLLLFVCLFVCCCCLFVCLFVVVVCLFVVLFLFFVCFFGGGGLGHTHLSIASREAHQTVATSKRLVNREQIAD